MRNSNILILSLTILLVSSITCFSCEDERIEVGGIKEQENSRDPTQCLTTSTDIKTYTCSEYDSCCYTNSKGSCRGCTKNYDCYQAVIQVKYNNTDDDIIESEFTSSRYDSRDSAEDYEEKYETGKEYKCWYKKDDHDNVEPDDEYQQEEQDSIDPLFIMYITCEMKIAFLIISCVVVLVIIIIISVIAVVSSVVTLVFLYKRFKRAKHNINSSDLLAYRF